MKSTLFVIFVTAIAAPFLLSQEQTKSDSVAAKTARKTQSASHSATAKRAGAKSGNASRKSGVASWQRPQMSPTADRYRAIQQALMDKGYLKSEPNGVWNNESAEALRQFQTDKNLPPTGKINAASLIGLGLGPKTASTPEADLPALPQQPAQSAARTSSEN